MNYTLQHGGELEPNAPHESNSTGFAVMATSGLANLGFRATGLNEDEQEIVLAMLRSLELEPEPGTLK